MVLPEGLGAPIRAPLRAVLDGSVLVDGQPAVRWSAGLRPANRPSGRPDEFPQTTLDAEGHLHLETPVVGAQTLMLSAAPGTFPRELRVPLDLVDGQRDWSLSLGTCSVHVTGVPALTYEFYRPHLLWAEFSNST